MIIYTVLHVVGVCLFLRYLDRRMQAGQRLREARHFHLATGRMA